MHLSLDKTFNKKEHFFPHLDASSLPGLWRHQDIFWHKVWGQKLSDYLCVGLNSICS